MDVVNNRFWRLDAAHGSDVAAIIDSSVLTAPAELIPKLRRRDGIVLGTWISSTEQAAVHALGIVGDLDKQSAVVDWRRYTFAVHPSGPGGTQWRTRPFFRFAEHVATRYRLAEHFRSAFLANNDNPNSRQVAVEKPRAPAAALDPCRSYPATNAPAAEESLAPQCNRVTPDGQIFATRERGLFMGNRAAPRRWLICDLHFKRNLRRARKYTKLFFLDEAVALAAGHRPCNTCRRDRYQAYLASAKIEMAVASAAELDTVLQLSRRSPQARSSLSLLPDGAFVCVGDGDYRLKWSRALHRWTPAGYVDAAGFGDFQTVEVAVLTPAPSLAALRHGYNPVVHPSARG